MYLLLVWRGCFFGLELFSFYWVLFEIVIFILVEEVGFYYSYRYMLKDYFSQYLVRRLYD